MSSGSQTFVFADLAGFTALTEVHGDDEAADLVGAFCAAIEPLLAVHDTDQIKVIGDAVMLRAPTAEQGVGVALAIVCDVGRRPGFPTVRAGAHSGAAAERSGDWFGSAVNLAARVSGLAGGGEVLLTAATRAAAGDIAGVRFEDHGWHRFKNVEDPVQVYVASREGAPAELPIDPVCRMGVDPADRAGTLRHEDVEYSFCSLECARRFAGDPPRFTGASAVPRR